MQVTPDYIKDRLSYCPKTITTKHHFIKEEHDTNEMGEKVIYFKFPRCMYCKVVNDYVPDMQEK